MGGVGVHYVLLKDSYLSTISTGIWNSMDSNIEIQMLNTMVALTKKMRSLLIERLEGRWQRLLGGVGDVLGWWVQGYRVQSYEVHIRTRGWCQMQF